MLTEGDTYVGRARKTCSLTQASQIGGAGDLLKMKRNYHLEQVVKLKVVFLEHLMKGTDLQAVQPSCFESCTL